MPRHVRDTSLLLAALVAYSESPEGSVSAPDAMGDTVVAASPVATDDVVAIDAGAPDVPRLDAGADVAHVDAGFDAGFDVGVDVAQDVFRADVPADVGVDAGAELARSVRTSLGLGNIDASFNAVAGETYIIVVDSDHTAPTSVNFNLFVSRPCA